MRLRGRVAKRLARQLLETEHRVEELREQVKEERARKELAAREVQAALKRLPSTRTAVASR